MTHPVRRSSHISQINDALALPSGASAAGAGMHNRARDRAAVIVRALAQIVLTALLEELQSALETYVDDDLRDAERQVLADRSDSNA